MTMRCKQYQTFKNLQFLPLLLWLLVFDSNVQAHKQYDFDYYEALTEEKKEVLSVVNTTSASLNSRGSLGSQKFENSLTLSSTTKSLSYCLPKQKYPLHPAPKNVTGKKGVGLTLRNSTYIENVAKVLELGVHWNYGWSINRIEQQPTVSSFVPMLWGGHRNSTTLQTFVDASNLQSNIASGRVSHVLGFNEPDHPKQANYTVEKAIEQWQVLHKLNVPLVSPSCVNAGSQWMIDFMSNATKNCLRVDYLGVHWYGWANASVFKRDILSYWDLHKMPIIITEFAPADWTTTTKEKNRNTPAEVLQFMKLILPWLERRPFIYGYAWYPFTDTNVNGWSSALYFSNGTLTAAGRYYKSIKNEIPDGDKSIRPDPPFF
jgi:Glycosyl hydrolase catalytic core